MAWRRWAARLHPLGAFLHTFLTECFFQEFRISSPAELGRQIGCSYARGAELAMRQGSESPLAYFQCVHFLLRGAPGSLRFRRAVDMEKRCTVRIWENFQEYKLQEILNKYRLARLRLAFSLAIATCPCVIQYVILPASQYVRRPYNAQLHKPDLCHSLPFPCVHMPLTCPFFCPSLSVWSCPTRGRREFQ